ncbi:MAG: hypothetical protein WBX22_26665 [Silvibacterium sp.]
MPRNELKGFDSGFDTYTVMSQIGSSGSGTVYEVKDSQGRRLALKIVDGSRVSKDKLKRFRNEFHFCLQPRAKHIIRVLDHGKSEEAWCSMSCRIIRAP